MKLFRRKAREERLVNGPNASQQSVIDLTALEAAGFEIGEINSILNERNTDLDRLEGRIEVLLEQGHRLGEFDPAHGIERKGSVETLDLREMMVAVDDDDDGVDRWFDAAFAQEGSDTVARNWLEQS